MMPPAGFEEEEAAEAFAAVSVPPPPPVDAAELAPQRFRPVCPMSYENAAKAKGCDVVVKLACFAVWGWGTGRYTVWNAVLSTDAFQRTRRERVPIITSRLEPLTVWHK